MAGVSGAAARTLYQCGMMYVAMKAGEHIGLVARPSGNSKEEPPREGSAGQNRELR